jgi:hypothetical protein
MKRTEAVCRDCKTKFAADEQMLEAGDVLSAVNVMTNISRVGVLCPSCTSPNIQSATQNGDHK